MPPQAWTVGCGAQWEERPDAEDLVEDGKFEAGFIRKQVLGLGLKGSVDVHRVKGGSMCHTEGTAYAKARRQVSSAAGRPSRLALAD